MTLDELVTLTRDRLAARRRRVVEPGPLVRAAVLVPLVERGGPHLIFAKRTDRVGTHRGQISFPGGTIEPACRGEGSAASIGPPGKEIRPRWVPTRPGRLPKIRCGPPGSACGKRGEARKSECRKSDG